MKVFSSFIEQLRDNLKKPLPHEAAHQFMEATVASYLHTLPNQQTRQSAVLILLYPYNNEVYFPLIVRASDGTTHSGQMAFPGGRQEPTDEDLIHTALREAQEEVGLKPEEITILGTLTEIFIAPSNFIVLPVIGFMSQRPRFIRNTLEVEKIIEVKLNHFLNSNTISNSEIPIPGEIVLTPHYIVGSHKLWGATAKMISELLLVTFNNNLSTNKFPWL